MKSFIFHSRFAACAFSLFVWGCTADKPTGVRADPDILTRERGVETAPPPVTPAIATVSKNQIRIELPPIDPQLKNPQTEEYEAEFWQRANQAIAHYKGQKYGNTWGENEKKSYHVAMFDFLAGNRDKAIAFLQSEDPQSSKEHAHTEGIDYYFTFTLKGQIRKYFLFGSFLDPEYRQRMYDGARNWTAKDPDRRPHPRYGMGRGGNGWGPDVRGGWVDGRNTDNLKAMRDISVYLMAEETGNEEVRKLYKEKLQNYVSGLYQVGMSEWDSENYHCHTIAPYLNLYDFAKDPEVKQIAKAGLDWLAATAAVKYYRGGFGGPTKRDFGGSNVVYGSAAARCLWQWFGDVAIANPKPERDVLHLITSAYRPPQAVVALAQKKFDRPVEVLATKPIYNYWMKRDGKDKPAYWETHFFGKTYQMGSVVSAFSDGDVGPFKLMAENRDRGVDYFVANTGSDRVKQGKNKGDRIAQYRNLAIWLRPTDNKPFFFQLPKTTKIEVENGIWFVPLEKTWLALFPINLSNSDKINLTDDKSAELYKNEITLKSTTRGNSYAGFALEVGEATSHGTYNNFKQIVKNNSQLDLSNLARGTVQLTGATGETLQLTHNSKKDLPIVVRNGDRYDWLAHFDLYQPTAGNAPISLGWKQGTLRVEAGDFVFESTSP